MISMESPIKQPIRIREQLGVSYQQVLVPLEAGGASALADAAGTVHAVQEVP